MITFLPNPDFEICARVLDYQRLNSQRRETRWLLDRVIGNKPYINHPLVRMWKDYPRTLAEYGIVICQEWISRGYIDNQLPYFEEVWEGLRKDDGEPYWLDNEELFSSHRTKLLMKNPIYYSQFNWKEKPDPSVNYYWPS